MSKPSPEKESAGTPQEGNPRSKRAVPPTPPLSADEEIRQLRMQVYNLANRAAILRAELTQAEAEAETRQSRSRRVKKVTKGFRFWKSGAGSGEQDAESDE